MAVEDEFADAFADFQVDSHEASQKIFPPFIYATWVGAEAVDANLSRIRFPDGSEARGVPRWASVTGLSPGVQVQCANAGPDKPLCIAGIVLGNITLYEAP